MEKLERVQILRLVAIMYITLPFCTLATAIHFKDLKSTHTNFMAYHWCGPHIYLVNQKINKNAFLSIFYAAFS